MAAPRSLRSRLVVVAGTGAAVALTGVLSAIVLHGRHVSGLAGLRMAESEPADGAALLGGLGSAGELDVAASSAMGLLAVVLVLAGALAVAVIGLLLQARSAVTGPLADLASEARASTTAPDRPVRAMGPVEVQRLAHEVEALRADLARRLAQADQAHAELEVAHRLLIDQAEELRRSNADLEQFAYVASHDLQEPLRKVASFTQLLARRYQGQLDERADEYIAYAVDGARRMQHLVDELLGIARVGRQVGRPREVDLAEVLDQVVADLHPVLTEAEATVQGAGLPVVRGNRALLNQLLTNLVRNAVTYRGVSSPVVQIGASRVEDRWELACRDNGVGIDPADAERVFVLFERVQPREGTSGTPGTGIGLALCRRIVEHHGGQIWVDPASTGGATIRWTLPA